MCRYIRLPWLVKILITSSTSTASRPSMMSNRWIFFQKAFKRMFFTNDFAASDML